MKYVVNNVVPFSEYSISEYSIRYLIVFKKNVVESAVTLLRYSRKSFYQFTSVDISRKLEK